MGMIALQLVLCAISKTANKAATLVEYAYQLVVLLLYTATISAVWRDEALCLEYIRIWHTSTTSMLVKTVR
jgi:hypothetical protein